MCVCRNVGKGGMKKNEDLLRDNKVVLFLKNIELNSAICFFNNNKLPHFYSLKSVLTMNSTYIILTQATKIFGNGNKIRVKLITRIQV